MARDGDVAGLLLAAGGGQRFGRPKALLPWGPTTLLEHALATLDEAKLAPTVVVVGADGQAVAAAVDRSRHLLVPNDEWAAGMGGSLRLGLAALRACARAVVVTLVDQPLVTAAAIQALVHAWRDGADAAVATYDGCPANPVLLDRSVWAAVETAAVGDVGARAYLRAHPDVVAHVPCDGMGGPADIDTPEDLHRMAGTGPAG